LLGLVGWWMLQANDLTQRLQEDLDIIVELEAERGDTALDQLMLHLRAAPYLRPDTPPEFIKKEESLADMGASLEQDLEALGLNNPLLDVVTFNVPLGYLHTDSLRQIAAEVGELPGVGGVYYQENFVERIAGNARKLGYLLLGLTALFTLVAGLLIHNTVRLSLYANRFQIKTQELVGASWGFISRPFLWRAVGQGIISGGLAAAGLYGLQRWIAEVLPELNLVDEPLLLGSLFGGVVLLGILINFISHYIVVRRYLRLRVDDLY
jgi:cell division transport system permease protein